MKNPTRKDPVTFVEAILDPVITTLHTYYQTPRCLPPLDPDPDTNGKPSDHRIVLVRPISAINNQCARTTRHIKIRPITECGMFKMRKYLENQNWNMVYESQSAHEKASVLQELLLQKFNEYFPEKTHRINSDDQPWISHKLKNLDRRRKREYQKHRRSEKWLILNKDFKESVKCAKKDFYKNMMKDLMSKNTSHWYSSIKRMTSHDQQKYQNIIIPEINNLSDEEQAQKLSDHFSAIPNEYNQLKSEDIPIDPVNKEDIPQIKEVEVWMLLSQLKKQ